MGLAACHLLLIDCIELCASRNFPDNSLDSIAQLHKLQELELSGIGFTETASKPSVRLGL